MENINENHDDQLSQMRLENEEMKKKLAEEFGAAFSKMPNSNLPPEIESQFLDYITTFESQWNNAARITLYEYLEKPACPKPEELKEGEIASELSRIEEIMNNHQVRLSTLCEVADRELYRFIVEELFQEEIDDMHIPGMFTNYIYEDFHPNHEYDIRRHSADFISSYLNKEHEFYKTFLTKNAENADWHLHFRNAFCTFELIHFSITELEFDTDKATVCFECNFKAKVEGSMETLCFSGLGELDFLCQWDFWCVDEVILPKGVVCIYE